MTKSLFSLFIILALSLSLQGCKGGSSANDGTGALFGTSGNMDFSGTYDVTVGSSSITSALGSITSITLIQAGDILQAVDNLGNEYKGTLIGGYDENDDGAIENNELQATMTIEATTSSGITITLICASDSEVQSYTPGSSTTNEEVIEQTTSQGGTSTTLENYVSRTVTNVEPLTVIWKQFSGQIILSGGASHAGTIVMKGDIVTTGGNSTSTRTLTKL